ncbi:MAG TPA: GNAT family N-acetyltransferase [Bacillota bacterium]|nr:GNAT family N-acetyltransferase [Bacillota bacterium]
MIKFVRAKIEDAEKLTEVQIKTFDDDSRRFFGQPHGGPPGYNSVKWQLMIMRKGIYYKILDGSKIIGGIIVFKVGAGNYNLGRIYIDPEYQDQGIGTQAMNFIESTFRDAQRWTLETPKVATRNHHFYEKLGYIRVGNDGPDGYLYEKRLNDSAK